VPAPVRRRDDFDALSRSRARARSGPLRATRAPLPEGDDADLVRVAYAVPRAVGTAVVRNRVRRRLRAMTAELEAAGDLAPGLYLIGAGPGAEAAPAAELRTHLVRALSALAAASARGRS
jgi:ribonuclease P protein component